MEFLLRTLSSLRQTADMEHGHPSGALRLAFVCLRGGSVLMGWGHYYYDSLGTHCTVYNSRDGRENNLFLKHRDATGMSQASKCMDNVSEHKGFSF